MEKFLSIDFSFEQSSKSRRAVEALQLINLLYIGVAEPMYVGFLIPIEGVPLMLDGISLALSLLVIFLNFRTPILVKNEMTLRIDLIAKNYWHNGLLFDICGIIPLNMILGRIDITSLESRYLKCFLFVVRLVRLISFWHTLKIFL